MKKAVTLFDVVRWGIISLGLLLYCLIALFTVLGSRLSDDAWGSIWSISQTIIEYVVLGSGLPPLIVSVYFLGICKTRNAWLLGIILLPIFVAAHYVTVVFMAHASTAVHLPMILAELGAAVGAIWFWEKKGSHGSHSAGQPTTK